MHEHHEHAHAHAHADHSNLPQVYPDDMRALLSIIMTMSMRTMMNLPQHPDHDHDDVTAAAVSTLEEDIMMGGHQQHLHHHRRRRGFLQSISAMTSSPSSSTAAAVSSSSLNIPSSSISISSGITMTSAEREAVDAVTQIFSDYSRDFALLCVKVMQHHDLDDDGDRDRDTAS